MRDAYMLLILLAEHTNINVHIILREKSIGLTAVTVAIKRERDHIIMGFNMTFLRASRVILRGRFVVCVTFEFSAFSMINFLKS